MHWSLKQVQELDRDVYDVLVKELKDKESPLAKACQTL